MPLLYAVIARGSTVLVKHAACVGNFSEVTEQILNKIPAENSKLTYSHGTYLFHYIKEEGIVYLCITDDVSEISNIFTNKFSLISNFYYEGTKLIYGYTGLWALQSFHVLGWN